MRVLLTNLIEEVAQEVKQVSTNIRNAVPNLEPVRAGTQKQLQDLKQELQQNEDTKMILTRLRMGAAYLRQLTRIVLELARTARRIALAYIGGLRESLNSLPEKYTEILNKLPEYIEILKSLAIRGVDALISGSRVAAKVLVESAERLYEALPPFADVWNWLVDQTEGIVQVLSEFAQRAGEKLSKIYSAVKGYAERILANRTIQALWAELISRLQGILEEFIQDTKEQLETVKNLILSAVPQKEFQEFIESLVDYIQKKAEKAPIDDAAALRNIYAKLRATISRALADVFTYDCSKGIFRAQVSSKFIPECLLTIYVRQFLM